MRKIVQEFIRRGLIACGSGPLVLAVVYLILQHNGAIECLSVNQVCIGIFSLEALAFIAGGINVIYQIERIPLMIAILIHGGFLYIAYFITYILNGWLQSGITPMIIFTCSFVSGYIVIWVIIYFVTKKRTEGLNKLLKKKQENMVK